MMQEALIKKKDKTKRPLRWIDWTVIDSSLNEPLLVDQIALGSSFV